MSKKSKREIDTCRAKRKLFGDNHSEEEKKVRKAVSSAANIQPSVILEKN